jgi:RNA polymerase sigma-70 factor (ECF subfamily)
VGFQDRLEDFGSFYEATYLVAYRVAFGIVGEHALAEDAIQDAYVTALRKRASYRADGPAEAWLYRIVVNAAISVLRRRRVRLIQPLDPLGRDGPPTPDAAGRVLDHLTLMDGLQRLDPIARSAVVLRYYLDLDYETIGSIIGKSPSNVGSILSRSLDRLQPEVSPDLRIQRMASTRPQGADRHG